MLMKNFQLLDNKLVAEQQANCVPKDLTRVLHIFKEPEKQVYIHFEREDNFS